MGNLFRKSKSSQKETRIKEDDVAIAQLKVTRDKIKAYQKKLETNISVLSAGITDCIKSKKKDQALLLLRKKKYIEKNLSNTNGELLNIDYLVTNIENAQVQRKVFDALKEGNELLKQINKELTVEDVDKLMAETEEAIEYQNQIGLALSNQGVTEDKDLLEEFDKLETQEYDLPKVPDRPIQHPQPVQKKQKVVIENS
jgi:charged multivesicular body protein 6